MELVRCLDLDEVNSPYEGACMHCGMLVEDEEFLDSHIDLMANL